MITSKMVQNSGGLIDIKHTGEDFAGFINSMSHENYPMVKNLAQMAGDRAVRHLGEIRRKEAPYRNESIVYHSPVWSAWIEERRTLRAELADIIKEYLES